MKQDAIEFTSNNGQILRGNYQKPYACAEDITDPTLMIFCHGFPGAHKDSHRRLFEQLQNICALAGIHSLRFDFRGCGKSDGDSGDFTLPHACEDMMQVYGWAMSQGYTRFMLSAEGLGSLPALMTLREGVRCLAFFWPVFDPRQYAIQHFQAENYRELFEKETEERHHVQIESTAVALSLIKELYQLDLTPFMNKVNMPALIQHGALDAQVPIENIDLARRHFRNRRIELTTYQNGAHGILPESQRKHLLFHYEQFVTKYV